MIWSVLLFTSISQGYAASNFVPIRLPHGVQIELPRNWTALSNNQKTTLDASLQARFEGTDFFNASSDLNFAANYYDDAGKSAAIVNVRYYPDMDVTQAEAQSATNADVIELDSALRDAIVKTSQTSGISVLSWDGTRKQATNGIVIFVSEYKRSQINNNGIFKVRLVRVFNAGRSFTLTVSYRENQEYLLRPICDRIISTLRVSNQ